MWDLLSGAWNNYIEPGLDTLSGLFPSYDKLQDFDSLPMNYDTPVMPLASAADQGGFWDTALDYAPEGDTTNTAEKLSKLFQEKNKWLTGAGTLAGLWSQNQALKAQKGMMGGINAAMGTQNANNAYWNQQAMDANALSPNSAILNNLRRAAMQGAARTANTRGVNPIHVGLAANEAGANAANNLMKTYQGFINPNAVASLAQAGVAAGNHGNQARNAMINTGMAGLRDLWQGQEISQAVKEAILRSVLGRFS